MNTERHKVPRRRRTFARRLITLQTLFVQVEIAITHTHTQCFLFTQGFLYFCSCIYLMSMRTHLICHKLILF